MKAFFITIIVLFFSITAKSQQVDYITVSQDGTADYKTIQEAVNSVRDHYEQRVTIFVKSGIYYEKLVIPSWKSFIAITGEDKAKTIITNADYSGKPYPGKDFTGNPKFSTYTSYTVLIQGNDCLLQNLTIENTSGQVGQAVALHIEADRIIVDNCNILGNQDTLYPAKAGTRNYFNNCYINGTVDFIFGAATAFFENCTIESLRNSYITAASTTRYNEYGFVFLNCKLTARDSTVNKVYLGRPWRPYAKTVFINTEMGKHILNEGWDAWKGDKMFPNKEKTVYYAEYNSFGKGSVNLHQRVSWSHQLKKRELKKYRIEKVFNGWNPDL